MNLWILVIEFINLVENYIMKYLFVFLLVGLMVSCGDSGDNSKQPSCDEIDGLEITFSDWDSNVGNRGVPGDYTGAVYYCENGMVAMLTYFKNGNANGLSRGWYENGQLNYECNYLDWKKAGLSRTWYENGQLAREGKNIIINGSSITEYERSWHENGQLSREEKRGYDEDGDPAFNSYLEYTKSWHENGQLATDKKYNKGDPISAECWDKNGVKEQECSWY